MLLQGALMASVLVNNIIPVVLIHSDDDEIRSRINEDEGLSSFKFWFTGNNGELKKSLTNELPPQLAIIDSSMVGIDSLELLVIFKQQFNIPVILLINPEDFYQIPPDIYAAVDNIFTKPLQSNQLAVSIHFNLARLIKEQRKMCIPHNCHVVTQHIPGNELAPLDTGYTQLLDRQDFILKLGGLLEQIEEENVSNACVKISIIDAGIEETPQWRKRSLYLQNLYAGYIQHQIRYGDILARGDNCQYMLLLPGLDEHAAFSVVRRILESIFDMVNSRESEENLKVYTGLCVFDGKMDVGQIMTSANAALREAAQKGNGQIIVNNILGCVSEGIVRRKPYADIIKNALRDDAFFLRFQPIMELSDGSIGHYEALLRLQDKKGNNIETLKIITAAEQSNLIRDIDLYVLERVMQKIAVFSAFQQETQFSVNLSGTHFGNKDLLQDICILIDYYSIDPSRLVFEVTETAAVKDLKMASYFISSLKDLGCQFGLDDFGTGYASFFYLRALPVDYLKIDGTFVKDMVNNASDQLFIKAIVDVAKGMGIKTIAEYVENQETLLLLNEYGVDFGQGYYIGKPDILEIPFSKLAASALK